MCHRKADAATRAYGLKNASAIYPDETVKAVRAARESGESYRDTCHRFGISISTYYQWTTLQTHRRTAY